MKRMLLVLALLSALVAIPAAGQGFDYTYVGSYLWVPGTSTNQLLALYGVFNVAPDLVILRSSLGADGTDFRARLLQTRFTVAAGLDDDTNGDLITTSLSAAQKDSLMDQAKSLVGLGCVPVPAGGATYYGKFYWALAPAATDTIIVDAYKLR